MQASQVTVLLPQVSMFMEFYNKGQGEIPGFFDFSQNLWYNIYTIKKKGKDDMLSNYEREVATALVEALVEYGLTDHLSQYGEDSVSDWFCDMNLRDAGFSMRGGATKICVEHEDLDSWVVKVGYTSGVKIDYAAKEFENYCKAVKAGFACYFPETVFLGEFGGRAFYIQELADCDEEAVSSDWYERLRDGYDEDGEEYDPDSLWEEIDGMGDDEKAFLSFRNSALCNFLWENRITDLHEGNFGYIGDKMVIVDFAGYIG